MEEKPPEYETPDADAAFNRTLKNLLTTPHKPHDAEKKGREPKPAPKSKTRS